MSNCLRSMVVIFAVTFTSAMTACKRESSAKLDGGDGFAASTPTPDPRTASSTNFVGAVMAKTSGGSFHVLFTPRPEAMPFNEIFSMNVRVIDTAANAPATDVQLAADAAMPAHHHGMNTVPKVTRNADGSFTVRGMQLHMHGDWELYFDVTRDGTTQRAIVPVTLE